MTVARGDDERITKLEGRVAELEKFRSWLTGLFIALTVMGAFLADKAKKLFGV